MSITLTDLFCGAGGSSTGAIQIPGIEVKIAANHWDLAVETHNTNHPDAEHACVDLHEDHPANFPTTDIAWMSPECTEWSVANTSDLPDIDESLFHDPSKGTSKSRLLMFDVLRFIEHHRYRAVIVENVVDIATQPKYATAWYEWRTRLAALGYSHKVVSMNSMHAQTFGNPAPQSRDRLYIVCWPTGEKAPDLESIQRPLAWCTGCQAPVRAIQAWKDVRKQVGRYRQSYVWRCPSVTCRNTVVEPDTLPAASIIDWSNRGQRIGDRDRPLAEKTMRRILSGIDRFWNVAGAAYDPLAVPMEGRDGKDARPMSAPLRTLTTRAETAVALPPAFIAELRGGHSDARNISDPLATVTAGGLHHGLVTTYNGKPVTWGTDQPLPTVTTVARHALLMRNNTSRGDGSEMVTPAGEPIRTLTTTGNQSLLTREAPTRVDVEDVLFRMLTTGELQGGMGFPAPYVLLGTQRERARLAGNAVTPPAARDLVGAVVASLN